MLSKLMICSLLCSVVSVVVMLMVLPRSGPIVSSGADEASAEPLHRRSLLEQGDVFASTPFTHLVVGGGTAGLTLAARLSEDSSNMVGVIEAGPPGLDDPINDIPANFGANLGTKYDWNYTTQPSNNGGNVPSLPWPRGHVLGGSSVLNFLVWDRAATIEYDVWEQLGNAGWNGKTLVKYMRKAESVDAPSLEEQAALSFKFNPVGYGTTGPVKVSFPRYIPKQLALWVPALRSIGIAVNHDPLKGNNLGAAIHPGNIDRKTGKRSSSARSYFVPNANRKNLKVLTSALANRILFADAQKPSNSARKARGVEFQKDGKTYVANASKEVILSAGAVGSPKLLELSGVGRKTALQAAGVQQVIELDGVGENLQDHTYLCMAFETLQGASIQTFDTLRFDPTFAAEQRALYDQGKPSLLAQSTNSIAYLTLSQLLGATSKAKEMLQKAQGHVESQKNGEGLSLGARVTLLKQIEFLTKYPSTVAQMEVIGLDGYYANSGIPKPNTTYLTLLAAQQHLFSRGSIHIQSSQVAEAPVIRPNYFSTPYDQQINVKGLEIIRTLGTKSLYAQQYVRQEVVPGPDKDLKAYAASTLSSEYHPIGTCAMLPKEKGGVVDRELRVYGTSNVRVVDASVMPLHVSAHIQATVYGIAEAAADLMKGKPIS